MPSRLTDTKTCLIAGGTDQSLAIGSTGSVPNTVSSNCRKKASEAATTLSMVPIEVITSTVGTAEVTSTRELVQATSSSSVQFPSVIGAARSASLVKVVYSYSCKSFETEAMSMNST